MENPFLAMSAVVASDETIGRKLLFGFASGVLFTFGVSYLLVLLSETEIARAVHTIEE